MRHLFTIFFFHFTLTCTHACSHRMSDAPLWVISAKNRGLICALSVHVVNHCLTLCVGEHKLLSFWGVFFFLPYKHKPLIYFKTYRARRSVMQSDSNEKGSEALSVRVAGMTVPFSCADHSISGPVRGKMFQIKVHSRAAKDPVGSRGVNKI